MAGDKGEQALRVAKSVFATELANWSDAFALIAEDAVLLSSGGRLYLGPDGMVRWYRDAVGEAQAAGLAGGRFEVLSEELVLVCGDVARTLRSGAAERQPSAWLVRVNDGRLSAALCYRLQRDARAAAAGLRDTGPARGLTSSIVMRDRAGTLSMNLGRERDADAAAAALTSRIARSDCEDLGEGYLLVGPHAGEAADSAAWLVVTKNGDVGAALEFADTTTAKSALPTSVYVPTVLEVVESVIYAFAAGDSTRILPLLAPDFTYTDRFAGVELHGAVTAMTGLLLAQEQARASGLPGLEIKKLDDDTARVSGRITNPDSPELGGHWATVIVVENGRVRSAEREPNEAAG